MRNVCVYALKRGPNRKPKCKIGITCIDPSVIIRENQPERNSQRRDKDPGFQARRRIHILETQGFAPVICVAAVIEGDQVKRAAHLEDILSVHDDLLLPAQELPVGIPRADGVDLVAPDVPLPAEEEFFPEGDLRVSERLDVGIFDMETERVILAIGW